jgi:DNA-binding transcriptional MerR regulator
MPIGGLARLSRLTVKALRLYDAEGLLVPEWVDPDSGYRYYRAEQVRTATTIALLRSLGVPLSAIRDVLEAPDEGALTAVLEAERERAARDLAEREQVLRSIERLVRSPAAVRYDVTIAPQRARRLVGLTTVARTDHMGPDTVALCVRAAALLGDGEITALYPLDLDETFILTAGIVGAAPVPGAEQHELPAGNWASTLHVGPYGELPTPMRRYSSTCALTAASHRDRSPRRTRTTRERCRQPSSSPGWRSPLSDRHLPLHRPRPLDRHAERQPQRPRLLQPPRR